MILKDNNTKMKGFTLVELLAVIVILAIILVIAVPKIMDVINDAKKATLESTAKMIASAAEKAKVQNTVLGKDERITCENVAKINNLDYEDCDIDFDGNTAKVTIKGSGKFEGLYVCNGDKTNSEATNEECGLTCESGQVLYEEVNATKPYAIKNVSSCENYFTNILNEQGAPDDVIPMYVGVCTGETDIGLIEFLIEEGFPEKELIENNVIVGIINERCVTPVTDECFAFDEDTGTITGYDISCGTNILIPSKINDVTVIAIGEAAFTNEGEEVAMLSSNDKNFVSYLQSSNKDIDLTPIAGLPPEGIGIRSVVFPNTITTIEASAFENNLISNLNIPNSVTEIDFGAFSGNPLTNIYLGNQDATIKYNAFGVLSTTITHNLPSCYVSVRECPIP